MPATNYTALLSQALITYSANPIGLYNSLRQIHYQAWLYGDSVIYPVSQTFNIEVVLDESGNQMSIGLSPYTDFNNCIFNVTNQTGKTVDLFKLFSPGVDTQPVSIPKSQLHAGAHVYGSNNELNSSPKLIIVTDENRWTTRNEFNDSGILETTDFYRKDILFLSDNIFQNDPISTYNNAYSNPSCQYIDVSISQKVFKNLIFNRTSASTSLTNLVLVNYQYNVRIENVEITTPQPMEEGGIYFDKCISINHCAKVEVVDVTISKTYSVIGHWGYGFSLFNVWDSYFEGIIAYDTEKGVFDSNNTNVFKIVDSHVNRVDVHCYGKDITCEDCTFENIANKHNVFNRFSSFFGTLKYKNCVFDEFLPVRIDSAYNAFTAFDLVMEQCTLNVVYVINPIETILYNCIVHIPVIDNTINPRPELQHKCLPNLMISDLTLHIPAGITEFCFIKISNLSYTGNYYYMDTMNVDIYPYSQAGPALVTFYDTCYYPIQLVEQLSVSLERRAFPTIRRITSGA